MFDDRAVSEVIGYVIIFGIVISSVLLLSASGTTTLEDIRDDEQSKNAERAFDVLSANMAEVYEQDSPSRATEIDVGKAQLFYGNYTTIEVEVSNSSVDRQFEFNLRPIVLRSASNTELVYEGGAVFQTEREGGVMLREPPFLLSNDRVQISTINTSAPTVQAVSGTTALVRGQSTNREVLFTPNTLSSPLDEIHINITSPQYQVWEDYLKNETPLTCSTDPSTETVECSMSSPETVYVTEQEIELEIIL